MQVTLAAKSLEAKGLYALDLDITIDSYCAPGQFVSIGLGEEKPAYFAIASLPGEPLMLLVSPWGGVAARLVDLEVGASFEVSEAMGKGFDLEAIAGRPTVVLCGGSGISAVRPVVWKLLKESSQSLVDVFYGAKTEEHLAFSTDLEAWAGLGANVHVVLSQPSDSWQGPRGYVQDAAQIAGLVRSDVGVVLCGRPEMQKAVTELYLAAGCPAECVLTN